ncbi:unnamed protein product, partial [Symbiodinium sp. CCMP2456]
MNLCGFAKANGNESRYGEEHVYLGLKMEEVKAINRVCKELGRPAMQAKQGDGLKSLELSITGEDGRALPEYSLLEIRAEMGPNCRAVLGDEKNIG